MPSRGAPYPSTLAYPVTRSPRCLSSTAAATSSPPGFWRPSHEVDRLARKASAPRSPLFRASARKPALLDCIAVRLGRRTSGTTGRRNFDAETQRKRRDAEDTRKLFWKVFKKVVFRCPLRLCGSLRLCVKNHAVPLFRGPAVNCGNCLDARAILSARSLALRSPQDDRRGRRFVVAQRAPPTALHAALFRHSVFALATSPH